MKDHQYQTMTDQSSARPSVDPETLSGRNIPHPPHSWEAAQRCIRTACPADSHEWVALPTLGDESKGTEKQAKETSTEEPTHRYWRECRRCGIADVTAKAIGQDVETPHTET